MFRIGFKDKYRVLHINNEFGNHVVGGAGTYMNEIYLHKTDDTGIVCVNTFGTIGDYNIDDFPGDKDISI